MNTRRILEPIALGVITNIVVNYVFDPANPDFIIKEFIVACCLSVPFTELNSLINRHLDKSLSWTANPSRRFFTHLAYLLLAMIFCLDVVGNTYMWLEYGFLNTWQELLTINIIFLVMAVLLTILKWTTDFYLRWKSVENSLQNSSAQFDSLKSELNKASDTIDLQQGTSQLKVKSEEIMVVKSEHGTIRVTLISGDSALFATTLSQLLTLLPEHLFFQAARNAIIHRDAISSIRSASFGKVEVLVKKELIENEVMVVSRQKASAFRAWYNSSSV